MKKTFNNIIAAAFKAGARFGASYPEYNAIPEGEIVVQLEYFKARLGGHEWTKEDWLESRRRNGALYGS